MVKKPTVPIRPQLFPVDIRHQSINHLNSYHLLKLYNHCFYRAHLLDSKGLEVYGVYMPRENPAGCFMTGAYRVKDPGEEIPSAPPGKPKLQGILTCTCASYSET